jgi:hypothetical protein
MDRAITLEFVLSLVSSIPATLLESVCEIPRTSVSLAEEAFAQHSKHELNHRAP